ncbi:ABC transporter permease [Ekhidna sp.]|jgi:putative ABC transport system permease protein|uniref:ABC transporter permease n=1 Tax=Ekhidna sp. TaxID=2608089 RepID=UPI0032ECF0DA
MNKQLKGPPRWMDRIIEFYCRKDLLEDLQGDLHEYYFRNLEKSRAKANLIFLLDVFKFCRLYTIQKPKIKGQMTFLNLMGNYFKTSVRSIARNKLFSSINIVGLAVSMSVGLLMITYIGETLTFDEFHEKKDRIYRVTSTYQSVSNDDPFDLASTSVFIGEKLKEQYTGFEKVLIMRRNFNADIAKGENIINVRGHYSTTEFFDVFSFDLKSGDPATALKEPNSIILTEKAANKLFIDEDPVGQIVTAGEKSYTITGLMSEVPENSHIQFEALASFSTLEKEHRDNENSTFFTWRSIWMNYVYLLLDEGVTPAQINQNLAEIAAEENAKTDRYTINHKLESLLDIVPGRDLSNQIGPSINWQNIYQLLGLTLIIILSACFNYTNLSIARALRRAKEVGIRKVVGASQTQVLMQFVFEAILIAVFSLIIAGGFYLLIKPEFISSVVDEENIGMQFRWMHLFYFLLFAIAIGFVSGILPSMVLSKLKAISILTDVTKLCLFKGVNLRKVLIVFQFAISMALIIGATITYRQYNFSINYDLGFTSENILNMELFRNDSEILMTELAKLPEVKEMSRSGMIPSTGEIWGEDLKYKDPMDSVSIYFNRVDKNYTAVHELTFLAGGTFPYDMNEEDENPKFIIIDRALCERFGFEKPEDALGEVLYLQKRVEDDVPLQVTGVIENYQYQNLAEDPEPTALIQGGKDDLYNINIVISSTDIIGLMSKMEEIWTDVEKVHPFTASFMDDQIQSSYAHYKVMFRIFTFLAILAIAISTMGLLGMAVFTTETRIKEVSIRKVLGASEQNLIMILSRSFMIMLFISAIIAIPFTYFFFTEYILGDFKKRIDIGLMELLPGVLLIFLIGFLTISWQTIKAAKTNPADMLRDE